VGLELLADRVYTLAVHHYWQVLWNYFQHSELQQQVTASYNSHTQLPVPAILMAIHPYLHVCLVLDGVEYDGREYLE
jgi:hypothetical protein